MTRGRGARLSNPGSPPVHPLPDELIELIARRFRALADPTRIKLLDRLHEGESTVQELAALTGTTQQNVSKHLNLLLAAGITGRRRVGSSVQWYVADPGVFALCEHVCGSIRTELDELRRLVG